MSTKTSLPKACKGRGKKAVTSEGTKQASGASVPPVKSKSQTSKPSKQDKKPSKDRKASQSKKCATPTRSQSMPLVTASTEAETLPSRPTPCQFKSLPQTNASNATFNEDIKDNKIVLYSRLSAAKSPKTPIAGGPAVGHDSKCKNDIVDRPVNRHGRASARNKSKLRQLEHDLTEPQKLKESAADSMNRVRKTIELNINTALFKWELLGTGSHFERCKLRTGSDIDSTFLTTISGCEPVFNPPDGGAMFCALRVQNPEKYPEELLCHDSHGIWMSPKGFREYFSRDVDRIIKFVEQLRTLQRRITIEDISWEHSPAVQLKISDYKGEINENNLQYDMDLVPALRLNKWPEPAEGWKPKWLNPKQREGIKSAYNAYCTTKLHPSAVDVFYAAIGDLDAVLKQRSPAEVEELRKPPHKCKLWQLSFSLTEKHILLHLDGTLAHEKGKTCRKKVLKFMKWIKNEAMEQHPEIRSLMTLHLKAVLFEECDRLKSQAGAWLDVHLEERLHDVINRFLTCIRSRQLSHHFIKDVNLCSNMSVAESKAICMEYGKFRDDYLG